MDSDFLIPLFSILMLIFFYPWLMIYVAVVSGAGMFTWLILMVMISPIVALWYYVIRRRTLNYFKLLLDNKSHMWDIDKTLAEYQEMLKKKRED